MKNTTEQKRWLTPKELKEEYLFSLDNQARMRMKKIIPYNKIGKYVRYDRIEIDKWLENHAVVKAV